MLIKKHFPQRFDLITNLSQEIATSLCWCFSAIATKD